MTNRMRIALAVAVIGGVAVGAGIALLAAEDDDTPRATTTSSVAASTSTTQAPATDTSTAVWPVASSSTRYATPADAARGFAIDFVGFANAVVGEFRQGDTRSGEIDVQARAGGPVTTVLVRQLGPDDTWWVLGSVTANIQVTAPEALARLTSPVALTGTSTAFEATVSVRVFEDGNPGPLGTGIVMGGANGEFGPFDGSVMFDAPSQPYGALVLFTTSAEDGSIVEATVVRIHFS